ncbi:GNAT family N-acetyltransferase [Alteriqipengyuania sp.]|uniref:bifunctional helix-turn-helix transcriptional regulator/GNAT family N-acetyltransferase n=1 Tax=Alteriqipengyuania sp. TaxID=2800692 RepID=UPI003516D167
MDVVAQMGPSFLGSRHKRLGERMQVGAASVITDAGLPLHPGHMGILAALRTDSRTVGQLADACGTSQPGVTRALGQLTKLGLIADTECSDQRSRCVELTAQGQAAVLTLTSDIWPRVGSAAAQLLDRVEGDFLAQLAIIEEELAKASIAERAAQLTPEPLRIVRYDAGFAHHFRDINAEWIESMYSLEAADREVLENPDAMIIAPGGDILFVEAAGLGIVGACALRKTGATSFELTKMGVRESARGLKAGEFLLRAMIDRAEELGADPLYLLTNRKSEAAIHLYEKLGFVHDGATMADYGACYARCDVAMRYVGD